MPNDLQFHSRTGRPGRSVKAANQNPPLKWNQSPFMPSSFPPTLPRGGSLAAACRLILALLHLTMVATANAAQQIRTGVAPVSRPYLTAMNSPNLRFHEAASIAPLLRKPIAGGPPVAATAQEVAEVALANNHAAASTPPMPPPESSTASTSETPNPEKAPAPASTPKPILPDDTPKKVQAQDFLPLFRFPGNGSGEEVNVIPSVPTPPVPGTLPASSATYQQH